MLGQDNQLGVRGPRRGVTVTVNGNEVVFQVHEATGAQIKETAISQGVRIQQDFNLFIVKGEGGLKPVKDAETVELREDEKFRAVSPDDTSAAP